jgi:HK97 family phage major capsid protein
LPDEEEGKILWVHPLLRRSIHGPQRVESEDSSMRVENIDLDEEIAKNNRIFQSLDSTLLDLERRLSKHVSLNTADEPDVHLREAAGKWFAGCVLRRAELREEARQTLGLTKVALQEDVSAEGGYFVPKPLADFVARLAAPASAVRPVSRVIPMTSKTLDVPNFATEPTAAIVAEEATIPDSVPSNPLGQVTMTARKLASLFTMSLEVMEDSLISLGDLFLTVIAEKLAKLEDGQALEGDGAGSNFTGIVAASGVGSVNVGGALTNLDPFITALYGTLPYEAQPNGTWVMHPKTWSAISKLKDSQNRYQVNPVPVGAPPLSLLGRPVRLTDQVLTNRGAGNDTHVYLGDYQRGMLFGDRRRMQMDLNPFSKFGTAQIDGRILERVGILVMIPRAFVKVTNITV